MTFADLWRVFGRIGVLSFGGPAAQIALMHRELVEERDWLTEEEFLSALSFCMLLPGPEAMQLATYSGWKLKGVAGGLIAGLLFVLPGAFVVLALSIIYAWFGEVPLVNALFLGVKAAVVVIVLEALLKISKRTLKTWFHWIMAISAFAGIFALGLPFPLLVLMAGLLGFLLSSTDSAEPVASPSQTHNTVRTVFIWLAIWWAPVGLAWAFGATFFVELGLFFSTLAIVTFGGAYAVLAYMTQTIVEDKGWLSLGQMLDGLGLAETTPGPLILVTEFVGFQAGFAIGGIGLAVLAAIMTLWVTFTPCFLWIFAGAPFIERMKAWPRLGAALKAVTAAVVGVILSLSIWFALHVFFGNVQDMAIGPLSVPWPDLTSIDPVALLLSLIAAVMLFAFHWGPVRILCLLVVLAGVSHLMFA